MHSICFCQDRQLALPRGSEAPSVEIHLAVLHSTGFMQNFVKERVSWSGWLAKHCKRQLPLGYPQPRKLLEVLRLLHLNSMLSPALPQYI